MVAALVAMGLLAVLMLSSLLNIAYLLPISVRAFFCEPSADVHGHEPHAAGDEGSGVAEAPLPCVLALAGTASACVLLFVYPDPVYRLLAQL